MTNPSEAPPSGPPAPAAPPAPSGPSTRAAVATLSRDLADFLVELSITLAKHAIYPQNHPLLDHAVDGVANRLGDLFVGDRDSLSIGVARRQLIIEGVATDPHNAVLKELAQRLHNHHIGAVKFVRGIGRDELASALAALAIDPVRSEKPIGLDTERAGELWQHLRYFPLTYDRLQLIEDDPDTAKAMADQMKSGRATQLWIGLARAAMVSDTSSPSAASREQVDDNTSLEPANVARAIDEHQREEAYDQVIVGYLLQIGEELKSAEGPEAAGLQRRVSRLVGSLKESTLERLLEMGGDKGQRRRFLMDASQGITIEAVVDLVKAASAAEGQTVSHSMLRMLSKLANHPATGGARPTADPAIRDVMKRLVDDWKLSDPNPEEYSKALESMSSLRNQTGKASTAVPTECEPERMVQIAIEVGMMGPQIQVAMMDLCKAGRADVLLDLVERAPSEEAVAPVWEFLKGERILESLLQQQRVDMPLVARFVKRTDVSVVPTLLSAAAVFEDAKTRNQFYDLIHSLGDLAGPAIAERIPVSPPLIQRELLGLIGRLSALPTDFSARTYLESEEALVRREAVRLLLRNEKERDETTMSALSDTDDRVVFAGLTMAQTKCPPAGLQLIKQRVDRGELDSQLRTMGIRIVGQQHTPGTLAWLLNFVVTETQWAKRPKLRAASPEMLAALSTIVAYWGNDPATEAVFKLAAQSKEPEVRAKVAGGRKSSSPSGVRKHE
ncbi:MAG TPA: hypothetical protein VK481_13580 [Gemmatimonadaceae bacterium]|nr:hypothetical protein [Gemmatimonadaceae bacterium]